MSKKANPHSAEFWAARLGVEGRFGLCLGLTRRDMRAMYGGNGRVVRVVRVRMTEIPKRKKGGAK